VEFQDAMSNGRLASASRGLLLAGLFLGAVAIAAGSLVYFRKDEIPPFVIEKLPLPLEGVWLVALQVHVLAASFCLPACLLLQWKGLLRRAPRVHRWLGRVTGTAVLFALAPSGAYLALFAKGGALGTLGFLVSGAITVVGMVQAIRMARARRIAAHRRAALHVLAQLSVAVTSRALLVLLEAGGVAPEPAYLAALWLPVLGSAAIVHLTLNTNERRRDHEDHGNLRAAGNLRADHVGGPGL
jgi:uncharacterized membrane protein